MSMRSTNMLVGNGDLDQVGLATRADGYYGYADGLHTVSFYLKLFIGRIHIDATVADNPAEEDWFPIALGPSLDHIDFEDQDGTTKIETFLSLNKCAVLSVAHPMNPFAPFSFFADSDPI